MDRIYTGFESLDKHLKIYKGDLVVIGARPAIGKTCLMCSMIEKTIDKFLNNPKRGITQAQLTDVNEVRHLLITPVDKVFPPEIEDNNELEEDELTNEEQGDNS